MEQDPETKSQMMPPPPGDGGVVVAGFPDDELGDRIARLSTSEADELLAYLEHLGF